MGQNRKERYNQDKAQREAIGIVRFQVVVAAVGPLESFSL